MAPMIESSMNFHEGIRDAVLNKRVSRAFTPRLTGSLVISPTKISPTSSRTSSTVSSRNNSLLVGQASPPLSSRASSRTSNSVSSQNSSRVGTPSFVPPRTHSNSNGIEERCGCCSMDYFWKVYDSFRLMDKRGCGSVRRCDFYEASTEYVTLEMCRTINAANLHRRFKSNAAELTFQELIQLVWPNATDGDRKQMSNWAKLRDASLILEDSAFRGTRKDLKQIFDLLDVAGNDSLSMSEFVRARILTKAECQNLLRQWYEAFNKAPDDSGSDSGSENGKSESLSLSFNEFCQMTQKHLLEKYVRKEEMWEPPCHSAFATSKLAVSKLIAARQNYAPSSNKDPSTPEVHPKSQSEPREFFF